MTSITAILFQNVLGKQPWRNFINLHWHKSFCCCFQMMDVRPMFPIQQGPQPLGRRPSPVHDQPGTGPLKQAKPRPCTRGIQAAHKTTAPWPRKKHPPQNCSLVLKRLGGTSLQALLDNMKKEGPFLCLQVCQIASRTQTDKDKVN